MNRRLMDFCGRLEEMVASFDDASGAIGYAISGFSDACSFAFFLRLCGSTSSADGPAAAFRLPDCCWLADFTATIELCNSCLEVQKVSFNIGFVLKYPLAKPFPFFPAAAAPCLFDGIAENGRRKGIGDFASLRQHRKHTVLASWVAIGRGMASRRFMAAWRWALRSNEHEVTTFEMLVCQAYERIAHRPVRRWILSLSTIRPLQSFEVSPKRRHVLNQLHKYSLLFLHMSR